MDTLENISIAGTILRKSESECNIYKSLGITLIPLKEGREMTLIKRYVRRTQAITHQYNLELIQAYKILKPQQDEMDSKNIFDQLDNHQLLFHGSRMANFMGILSEGLRLPQLAQVANGSTLDEEFTLLMWLLNLIITLALMKLNIRVLWFCVK